MKKIFAIAALATFSAFASAANAATITFDPLEAPGNNFTILQEYSEAGYTLQASAGTELYSAQQDNYDWYAGSAGLFNGYGDGVTLLKQSNGVSFKLSSIDLAPVAGFFGPGASVTFIGNLHGGGTVSNTFTLDENSYSFQTFQFTGFSNVDSVIWEQSYNYHQFDNINVAAVPEPETYAMMLAGLGLISFIARRKKSA